MTQTRIYLDFAATSPLRQEALAAMLPYMESPSFNPSSLHHEGRRARAALEEARERIARVLGAKRKEIVFTSGGSEANALAILGLAAAHPGRHLVSSAIEHRAVLGSLEALAGGGYELTLLPVDVQGFVDPERFADALRGDTALASIMLANNEIGTIQAVEVMAAVARSRRIPFHTDAVAAAGWLPLDAERLGVDAFSLAAHKFGGPKGFGVLYVRDGVPLAPIVHGAAQERGRRAGTEDVAAAIGTAVALELAAGELRESARRVGALRDELEAGLLERVPGSRLNGAEPRLPNITNLSFPGVEAEVLAARLDLEGIAVSPGSACTSGVAGPSHVIEALRGGDSQEAMRLSLGHVTSAEEIARVLQVMPNAISEQRRT